MLFCFFLFVGLLCQGLTSPTEEVEVIEAISGSEETKEHNNSRNEPNLGHLSLESLMDPGKPLKKHAYNTGLTKMSNSPTRMNGEHYSHKSFGIQKNNKIYDNKNSYNGPPPPPPFNQVMDKYDISEGDIWPVPTADMPKIISLDVKCEKNLMKVYIGFDTPFYGIVFSKGHYSNVHCVHLPVGLGRTSAHFEIGIHSCGTSGNTENGLYGYGAESGSGTYFENIIVIQYDPQVQEVWDQARKLRCTWHDQYEKSVTFRPFPVDMLDVVRTDFAGDNVGCWMQIQVGKGPWASEVSGLVKIGQTMTMVLAIKDDDSKFDMLVRNCMAHDGKRAPIQLVDQQGCLTRPKLMSRFTKIKNFGASASVLSYAHFQAFKFPDSMEVHFQCTIQICRYQCPDQCSDSSEHLSNNGFIELSHGPKEPSYGISPPSPHHISIKSYMYPYRTRDDRRSKRASQSDPEKEVGVNRVIRVVSTGDLTFSLDENTNTATTPTIVFPASAEAHNTGSICMTNSGFAASLVVLILILILSCLMSAFLYAKLRPLTKNNLVRVREKNSKNRKSFLSRNCFNS